MRLLGEDLKYGFTSDAWIIRGLALAVALSLFTHWQNTGAYWAGLIMWLLCASGAELIIEVSARASERRRSPSRPLRGGRRRTDPPLRP